MVKGRELSKKRICFPTIVYIDSSEWNQKNLFCGWYDADLSEKGNEEAKQAGKVCRISMNNKKKKKKKFCT